MLSRLTSTVAVRSSHVARMASARMATVNATQRVAMMSTSHSQRQRAERQDEYRSPYALAGGALLAMFGSYFIGSSLVQADNTVVLQPKGGDVDYSALRRDLENLLDKEGYDDGSYGPLLARLAWHSAGTYDKYKNKYGSDGATMRFSPESNHGANAGLKLARDLLEPLKKKYPGCSYADLYTLAGGVAIESMGGPKIQWRPGRSDAKDESACPPDGSLPDASKKSDHIRDIFYRMGFNDREIVALIGAHSLGRCHTNRSGYSGPWTRAPTTFSNEFFRLLVEEKWTPKKWNGPLQYENSSSGSDLMMLPADLALVEDPRFKRYVEAYAGDEKLFFKDFAAAFQKLMELGVNFDKKTQVNLKPQ